MHEENNLKTIQFANDTTTLFMGFYNSRLFEDYLFEDQEERYRVNNNLDGDESKDIEVEFKSFKDFADDVGRQTVDVIKSKIKYEDSIIENIKFLKVISPREYNFTTDKLDMEIEYNEENLKEHIEDNKEDFDFYLKHHYRSYDGYWSFVHDSYDEFIASGDYYKYPQVMLEYLLIKYCYNDVADTYKGMWDTEGWYGSSGDSEYHEELAEIANDSYYEQLTHEKEKE